MMKIRHDGKLIEVEPYAVSYSNDLLNGVLLDGDETYAFLSDHVESHRDMMDDIPEMEYFDMTDYEVELNSAPHSWVVKSVAKLIVEAAEKITEEAG